MRTAACLLVWICWSSSACTTDVMCPKERVLRNGDCMCPFGSRLTRDRLRCIVEDQPDALSDAGRQPLPPHDGGEADDPESESTSMMSEPVDDVRRPADAGAMPPRPMPTTDAAPRPACDGRCPSGRCGPTGACVECFVDADCPSGRPLCQNTACVQCREGRDCASGQCQAGTCANGVLSCDAACRERRCQDKVLDVELGEECVVGVGGWDEQGCDPVRCRRRFWMLAADDSECANRTEYDAFNGLCIPLVSCPSPPCEESRWGLSICPMNLSGIEVRMFGAQCLATCSRLNPTCPVGLRCLASDPFPYCVNPNLFPPDAFL